MWELTKTFRFESAHTLLREIGTEGSMRIHGHSYEGLVTLRGVPDPATGMLVDLGALESAIEKTRLGLDHRLLDEVPGLSPATMENLCRWIWCDLEGALPNLHLVEVRRPSQGDRCSYRPDGA